MWVDLDDLDLAEGAPARRLDLVGDRALVGGLAGDVAGAFEPAEPRSFITPPNR